jgi:hypothetical protein
MSPPPTLDMGLIKAGAEGVLAPSKTEDGNAMSNSADEEEKRVLQELEEPQRSRDSGLVFAVMSPSMVRVHRQLIDRGLGTRAHVCVACVCVLGRGRFYVCVYARADVHTYQTIKSRTVSLYIRARWVLTSLFVQCRPRNTRMHLNMCTCRCTYPGAHLY